MVAVYPHLSIVDAPNEDATVLFDLCDDDAAAPRGVLSEGFSLGAPELQGEPDSIDPLYGPRTIEATLEVEGTKADAMSLLSSLARVLITGYTGAFIPGLWLRVELEPEQAPVWFRLLRPDLAALSWENVYIDDNEADDDRWALDLDLTAEPFAYGAQETITTQTVNNDPAAVSNPCSVTLPAIKGDAPTLLRVRVNPSNADPMHGYRWMLNVHSATTERKPTIWQVGTGDGFTPGTDCSAPASDSAFSNGSYRTISFATEDEMVARLSGSTPSYLPAGKHRILVRTARSDTSSQFTLRFGQYVGLGYEHGDTVKTARTTSTATGHATWVDLGEFWMPKYAPPKGESPGFPITPDIVLSAARVSGSGSLHIDAFMAVPVDVADTVSATTLFTHFPVTGMDQSAGYGVWDGDQRAFWAYSQYGVVMATRAEMDGAFPTLVPGAVNVLTVLQQVNGTRPFYGNDSSDVLSVNTELQMSYRPRYLNMTGA